MDKNISYRALNIGLRLGLGALFSTGVALAQYQVPTTPKETDMACSGIVTDQAVPSDSYVISGEDSGYKTTFFSSDYIYINHGRAEGVKVGDKFDVLRVVNEMVAADPWFKYQPMLSRAMELGMPIWGDWLSRTWTSILPPRKSKSVVATHYSGVTSYVHMSRVPLLSTMP